MTKGLLFSTLFLILSLPTIGVSQVVSGVVTDDKGEPLPYVSIYIDQTTIGTTTNAEGEYQLSINQPDATVVYQFVGYQSEKRKITGSSDQRIDVQLSIQSTELSEVVISADREDPAYAIIRKAIEKRPYYRSKLDRYACDVYVKGNQKIIDAPEKILGVEVGDLDGMIDSTRSGIVYLSESVSRLYVDGDDYKEVITSSKLSGNDQGYSFNSAAEMEFSFYENSIELQRQMVSPIADNALAYYRYRLEGVFQDDAGRLINKIKVIPKRDTDPTFYGTIYIVDDLWLIHSLELGITAAASQVFFIDSLTFNHVYVPVEDPDTWALFSNSISFEIKALGFELDGLFAGVYSNYDLDPEFDDGLFDNVIYLVEPASNRRDSTYWAETRPVPLTEEEKIDYVRKDSIRAVRTSKVYLDSVDRINNQFKIWDIVGGYNYNRRSKHVYWDIKSPISTIQFNTVQGYVVNLDWSYRKYFDSTETKRILLGGDVNYGFSEKKLRADGYITFRPNRLGLNEFTLSGGSKISQFDTQEPISPALNTYYSLLLRRNHAKYLGLNYLSLRHRSEPWAGVFLTSEVRWEDRLPLVNNSDFSYFRRDEIFTSNNPFNELDDTPSFDRHQALIVDVSASIRFKQRYVRYPDRKFYAGSKGPRLTLGYTGAFDIGGTDISYHKIAASLSDSHTLGVAGRFRWYANAGIFFDEDNGGDDGGLPLFDQRHFLGSEIFILPNSNYDNRFLLLPYYDYSTDESYFQVHLQHYFDGFLLDKIPAIRKLGWSLVAGAKHLNTPENPAYYEFHVGLNNIGYKIVRLVRFDSVWSVTDGDVGWGVRMSLGF